MILVKKWRFCHLFFFQEIQSRQMCFTIFQKEKTPFQALKTRSSNSSNGEIFAKGLTYGFVFFLLGNIGQENVFYDILEQEKGCSTLKKKRRQKSRKIEIFPKGLTYGFGPNLACNLSIFLAIQARKMRFTMLQNKKGLCTL